MKTGIKYLVVCFSLFLFGCTVSRGGNPNLANQDVISQIKPGVTTKTEVRRLLGEPQDIISKADGGERWGYSYHASTINPTAYIPIVGIFTGSVKGDSNYVSFHFSRDGVVERIDRSKHTSSSGTLFE